MEKISLTEKGRRNNRTNIPENERRVSNSMKIDKRRSSRTATPFAVSKSKKGYVYTLEVMIAVAIVLVAVVILFSTAQVPETSGVGLIKKQGYEVLEFLDQKDELRQLVKNGDEIELKKKVREHLTSGITLELDICTVSCSGQVPQNKNIVSVDYYVSGYQTSFFNKKVRMWMWGNF